MLAFGRMKVFWSFWLGKIRVLCIACWLCYRDVFWGIIKPADLTLGRHFVALNPHPSASFWRKSPMMQCSLFYHGPCISGFSGVEWKTSQDWIHSRGFFRTSNFYPRWCILRTNEWLEMLHNPYMPMLSELFRAAFREERILDIREREPACRRVYLKSLHSSHLSSWSFVGSLHKYRALQMCPSA